MRVSIITILSCLFTFALSAQDSNNVSLWTKYPGFIIDIKGDTVHGILMLKNKISNQGKVLFYESIEDEKPLEKYHPKDIKAYQVGPRYYETIKFSGRDAMRRYNFLLRIVDGPLRLFQWYYDETDRLKIDEDDILESRINLGFSEDELSLQNVLVMPDGEVVDLSQLKYLTNFKKNMAKLLSDDAELAEKIRNKEEGYRYFDIEKIIREYNAWREGS